MGKQFVLLLLLALAGWFGMGQAKAACVNTAVRTWTCNTQAEAWDLAEGITVPQSYANGICGGTPRITQRVVMASAQTAAQVQFQCNGTGAWNPETIAFFNMNTCASSTEQPASYTVGGDGDSCIHGCKYHQGGGVGVCLGTGTTEFCGASSWSPDGVLCPATSPDARVPFDPTKDICTTAASNYSMCVKPDGRHCVASPKGAQLCWDPNETGKKVTTDGSLGGDKEPGKNATTQPPSTQTGVTTQTTTTTTVNNNSNTTTIFSGTGNTGTGNVGNGGVDSVGGVTGGNGTGTGTGATCGGTGQPKCYEGEGTASGVKGSGDLYGKTDKTIGSVYGDFKTAVEGSPLVSAAGNFFGSCSGGGSCPAATWTAADYGIAFDLSSMCSGNLLTLLQLAGYVLLAAAGIYAFKIALL